MKILLALLALLSAARAFPLSFTDDLGRPVTVSSPKSAAALQGSLASLWLLAGGTLASATADCFSEPPAMTQAQAEAENAKWRTDGFRRHGAGVFSLLGRSGAGVDNAGAMMSPNPERLIARGVDFVLLSAKQPSHRKIEPTLTAAGMTCAFFDYDGFPSFLRIFKVLCSITGRGDLYESAGEAQAKEVESLVAKRPGRGKSVLVLRASGSAVQAKGPGELSAGSVLADLGARNVAEAGGRSWGASVSMERIIADEPDFIFVVTMGTDERRALEGVRRTLEGDAAWGTLRAVRSGRYIVLPRELFHFKPGARWAEGYRVLARLLSE